MAWSRTYGDCVELARPKIPVRYVYATGNFELRIAVGDRWYPRLYMNAAAKDGSAVNIVSDQVRESTEAGRPVPSEIRGERYQYFVRSDVLERNEPITLVVEDDAGKPIHKIVLKYKLTVARDFELEGV